MRTCPDFAYMLTLVKPTLPCPQPPELLLGWQYVKSGYVKREDGSRMAKLGEEIGMDIHLIKIERYCHQTKLGRALTLDHRLNVRLMCTNIAMPDNV